MWTSMFRRSAGVAAVCRGTPWAAGALGQQREDLELAAGERDGSALHLDAARRDVDDEVAAPQDGAGSAVGGSARQVVVSPPGLHPGTLPPGS
jgi:hypothetical protein